MEFLGDVDHVKSCFGPFETVLASEQDRYTVTMRRTIGSEIILVTPDCTPR
jgi:hypothetical protein